MCQNDGDGPRRLTKISQQGRGGRKTDGEVDKGGKKKKTDRDKELNWMRRGARRNILL